MVALSKLGRYDIVRVLGKGAMGTVYEARDPNLERRVAIKTIAVHGLSPEGVEDYEARFRTEARSAARLQHPNIVSVYDSGRDGETAYLVMEYVEGQDLKHHLDSGVAFTLEQTLRIMRDLLAALAYAHAQNIVHRDVKPANLMIEADGRVKLTDFGVARIQDAADATRTRGAMVGTLKYMSPEQVQGQPVDARADLFSAGIVLYQLLTARQPFRGDNEFAIIAQIVGVDPPAPTTVQPALPAAIDGVLARALAKAPQQRFAGARAFHDALVQACDDVQDLSTAPMPLDSGSGSGTWRRRSAPSFSSSSGSGGSVTGGSVPTVTQELELVYWKDVRDSDDPLDLQGFLDRFPDGIYADLARRRLRKLGVVFLGEQTATRVEPRIADAEASAAGSPPRTGGDAADPTAAQHGARRRRAVRIRSAVVAAIMLAAVGLVWMQASDGPADRLAAVAPPAPLAAAPAEPADTASGMASALTQTQTPPPAPPAPTSEPAPKSPVPSTPPVAAKAGAPADPAPAAEPVASAKTRPAAARVPGSADASPPARAAPSSAPTSAVATAAAAAASDTPPALASGVADPEQACSGRVLLGYQICMAEQCAKPMYARHAVCEQRRAAELARKQQQATRN
ncbi:MAG: serine/threonine protein kinase [Rhodoferax sp.]|nr:serine/threonine protein kinase [Rhodoferax sp.]